MILVSNFKDFYDWVAGTYYDEKLKLIRKTKTDQLEKSYKYPTYFEKHNESTAEYSILVAFGKCYPVILTQISDHSKTPHYPTKKKYVFFCITEQEQEKAVSHLKKHKLLSRCNTWRKDAEFSTRKWFTKVSKMNLDLFESPYYLINYNTFTNLPNLCELAASKYFNPVQFYQELAMWVGQHMYKEELVDIPDKNKVTQKGFDPVYGFRKLPSKC